MDPVYAQSRVGDERNEKHTPPEERAVRSKRFRTRLTASDATAHSQARGQRLMIPAEHRPCIARMAKPHVLAETRDFPCLAGGVPVDCLYTVSSTRKFVAAQGVFAYCANNHEAPAMNLPLQMGALSRGPTLLSKRRAFNLSEPVIPACGCASATPGCTANPSACVNELGKCYDCGTIITACCVNGVDCSSGSPICTD
jgi:hypothetical protein